MEYTGKQLVDTLHKMEIGTPIRTKMSPQLPYEQAVYGGYKEIRSEMHHIILYYNRLEPRSAFSDKFFLNNSGKVFINTDGNDAEKVMAILKLVGLDNKEKNESAEYTTVTVAKAKELGFEWIESYKGVGILKHMEGKNGLVALHLQNGSVVILNHVRNRQTAKKLITERNIR